MVGVQAEDGQEQVWVMFDPPDGAAILVWPAWRISPIARLRSVTIIRGRDAVLTREASSRQVTSRTQWILFSMDQWPRT